MKVGTAFGSSGLFLWIEVVQTGILREKFIELKDEFRQVSTGNSRFVTAILPLLIFLILDNVWQFRSAAYISLFSGILLAVLDLYRGRKIVYSLGGFVLLGVAIVLVAKSGRAGSVLLPSIGSNGIISILCILSLVFRRPLVAWTSYFARHFPLQWYWHPKVRPAYSEVTFLWAFFFGARALWQLSLSGSHNTAVVSFFSLLTGWPSTLVLLVISYLYGIWRLRKLGGPGVDEFRRGDPPPWQGQKRGF